MENSKPYTEGAECLLEWDQFQHCKHVATTSLMPPWPLQTFSTSSLSDTELTSNLEKKIILIYLYILITSVNRICQCFNLLAPRHSFRRICPSFIKKHLDCIVVLFFRLFESFIHVSNCLHYVHYEQGSQHSSDNISNSLFLFLF